MNRLGYARVQRIPDRRGNCVEESYYDLDGAPVADCDGVFTCRWKYNRHGNRTETSFYGCSGEPVNDKSGTHSIKRGYGRRHDYIEEIVTEHCRNT